MRDDFALLGQTEEEVLAFYQSLGTTTRVKYTLSPKTKMADTEKRVIRISKDNEIIEILVAFFQTPQV